MADYKLWDGALLRGIRPHLNSAFYVGVCALIIGTLMFIQAIAAFFMGTATPGWTSIVATIIFFGGVQCFVLGVYGEYFLRNLFRSNLPTFVIKGTSRAARNAQESDEGSKTENCEGC